MEGKVGPITRCGVVVQSDKEEDRARNVDKGVYAVCPVEDQRVCKKPMLDGEFVEDMQTLFEVDKLKRVFASYVHGTFGEIDCCEGAA